MALSVVSGHPARVSNRRPRLAHSRNASRCKCIRHVQRARCCRRFDGVSRLASLVHNPTGTAADLSLGFAWNPVSQIAAQTSTNSAYDWAHPADFSNAYTVNGLNQYLTAAGAVTHDARGNLTGDPGWVSGSTGAKTYAYDADNRLVSVAGAATATLTYDPAGRLYQLAATAPAASTARFLYDPLSGQPIAEYDGANAVKRRFIPGAAPDETVAWYEGATLSDRRRLLADARGSIIAWTDANGNAPAINKYDAFGIPASANVGRIQFTGQMWLAEIGLYYYKARLYHPAMGRFLQTDPIGYAGGVNLYAYVGNDPVNFTDPSGLSFCFTLPNGDLVCTATQGAECRPGDVCVTEKKNPAGDLESLQRFLLEQNLREAQREASILEQITGPTELSEGQVKDGDCISLDEGPVTFEGGTFDLILGLGAGIDIYRFQVPNNGGTGIIATGSFFAGLGGSVGGAAGGARNLGSLLGPGYSVNAQFPGAAVVGGQVFFSTGGRFFGRPTTIGGSGSVAGGGGAYVGVTSTKVLRSSKLLCGE